MANIFRTASVWLKGAIICFALGLLLFIIGFSTYAWITWDGSVSRQHVSYSNGLWQTHNCNYRGCSTYSFQRNDLNSYHEAIQAMECLGLIGFVVAIVILLLYLIGDSCRRRDFLQATTALTFAGVLFACIGFALFGSSSNQENRLGRGGNIGWSMGLAISGTILYGIGGIFLIIQLVR